MPSYQLFCLARLALPFLSIRPCRCVHPFVSTLPSYLLFLSFRFNSHLTFHRKLENAVREKSFLFLVFKGVAIRAGICRPSNHLRPLAATCGHLRPLAATCGHLRPLAATCGHLRPLAPAATCGHLRSLGCKWLQVAAFLNFKYRAFCDLNSNKLGGPVRTPYDIRSFKCLCECMQYS